MSKLLSLMAVLAVLSLPQARSQTSPIKLLSEYSVDMEMHSGNRTVSTKMFKTKEKTRLESSMQGQQSISIMRQDLKKMYMLMPAQKMYMEMELNTAAAEKMSPSDPSAPKGDMKWEKLGSETVNGVACDKYKVTATVEGRSSEMFYYVDAQGRLARMETMTAGQTTTIDYKNWNEGSQDASLFEVPAGYNKMAGMGGAGR